MRSGGRGVTRERRGPRAGRRTRPETERSRPREKREAGVLLGGKRLKRVGFRGSGFSGRRLPRGGGGGPRARVSRGGGVRTHRRTPRGSRSRSRSLGRSCGGSGGRGVGVSGLARATTRQAAATSPRGRWINASLADRSRGRGAGGSGAHQGPMVHCASGKSFCVAIAQMCAVVCLILSSSSDSSLVRSFTGSGSATPVSGSATALIACRLKTLRASPRAPTAPQGEDAPGFDEASAGTAAGRAPASAATAVTPRDAGASPMRRAAVAIIVVLEPTRGVPVVTTAGAIAPTEQQLILLRVRRVRLARPRKKCDEGRDGVWPRGGHPYPKPWYSGRRFRNAPGRGRALSSASPDMKTAVCGVISAWRELPRRPPSLLVCSLSLSLLASPSPLTRRRACSTSPCTSAPCAGSAGRGRRRTCTRT